MDLLVTYMFKTLVTIAKIFSNILKITAGFQFTLSYRISINLKYCLLNAYYVPGTTLSTLCKYISFHSYAQVVKYMLLS